MKRREETPPFFLCFLVLRWITFKLCSTIHLVVSPFEQCNVKKFVATWHGAESNLQRSNLSGLPFSYQFSTSLSLPKSCFFLNVSDFFVPALGVGGGVFQMLSQTCSFLVNKLSVFLWVFWLQAFWKFPLRCPRGINSNVTLPYLTLNQSINQSKYILTLRQWHTASLQRRGELGAVPEHELLSLVQNLHGRQGQGHIQGCPGVGYDAGLRTRGCPFLQPNQVRMLGCIQYARARTRVPWSSIRCGTSY